MPLLPMIYLGAKGGALRTENNRVVKTYQPFWATPDFIHRYKRGRHRLLTLDEYGARLWAMTEERLRQEAAIQDLSQEGTREQLLQRLCAPLAELRFPDDPLSHYTLIELRMEAMARGLAHMDSRQELLEALKVKTPVHPGDPIEGYLDPDAEEPEVVEEDGDFEALREAALSAGATTKFTKEQADEALRALTPEVDASPQAIAALKAAVDKDDYSATWTAITTMTEARPASKAKPEVMSFARRLLEASST